jgi:hypothetical protein
MWICIKLKALILNYSMTVVLFTKVMVFTKIWDFRENVSTLFNSGWKKQKLRHLP